MAYQHDFLPIEYLERRVKYYEKKIRTIKNLIKSKRLLEEFDGEDNLQRLIDERIKMWEGVIIKYEEAILKLCC